MGLMARADRGPGFLSGKRAFILGGSGGIGRAVTLSLAERGAHVVCHGANDRDRLARIIQYITTSGGTATAVLRPIRHASDVPTLLEQYAPLDIVVIAYGPVVYADLSQTAPADWMRLVEMNLAMPGMVLSHMLPRMINRGWGRIVLFGGSRTDAVHGFRSVPAYAAAKTGLSSLVKSAAHFTGDHNVTVNAILPGYVDTEYLTPAQREEFLAKSPRGRLIPAERIGRVVAQLFCAQESDINGALLSVDQGLV